MEGASISQVVNLSTGEEVMAFIGVNNTLGQRAVSAVITAGNDSQNQTCTYDLKSVSIDSFQRVQTGNLSRVYLYTIRNTWENGTLSWSLSDPGITNSTLLDNNQSLMVFVAGNYTQGDKTPTLNASMNGYATSVKDHFVSKPLALTSLLTLYDGTNAVTELAIQNAAGVQQDVTWKYDTGLENITSSATVNSSIIVLVQANYTNNRVYRTTARVNASTYNDTRSGVVIA